MKTRHRSPFLMLALLAALLESCAPHASVRLVKPPDRAGFAVPGKVDARTALDANVAAAAAAFRELERDPGDSAARDDYNFAVARICGAVRDLKLEPWKVPVRTGSHTLAWKRDARPDWYPGLYELTPVDELEIRGKYVDERETKEGLGAALVVRRVADQVHEFAPTPHFYHGVTAVIRFRGSRAELAFEDPLAAETTEVAGRRFPLAADFTAPLAMMLVEMHPEELELPRLLHPARFADTTRIARLDPYDRDKTVVLFVHGLMDSPATWFPMINHLRGEEDIRRNYQFWFFSYPSGYPYSYSAALLRRELDHAEERYPSRGKMVVVGHSMGGCISRLLVTDTGDRVWNDMFTTSPEAMEVTPAHKHILTESTIFSHRPEIGRVIFISSPLRGSDLASRWMGRLGSALVEAPMLLVNLGREESRYERHAAGELHLKRYPDSVDTLAPNNHFVMAINRVPMRPGIPYHTIAGDRGRGDAPESSDGVVSYWSSHVPAAHSETIVPSNHSAHRHPKAIEEVHRILREHARQGRMPPR